MLLDVRRWGEYRLGIILWGVVVTSPFREIPQIDEYVPASTPVEKIA